MIPFLNFPTYAVGPITLQTWGTFVAIGIVVAAFVASRRAKTLGLDSAKVWDMAFWIVIAAFAGARLGHILFYEPAYFAANPGEILTFWHGGFSSFGGFIGGVAAGVFFIKKYTLDVWRWSDAILFGLPIGWAIGRIGCFLIHDHPGTLTDFVGSVQYPGGARHDLGLYDAVNAALLALALFLFRHKLKLHPGATVIVVSLWYGISRFLLDFLRATDVRYFGLTPGHYGSIVLVGVGVYLLVNLKNQKT